MKTKNKNMLLHGVGRNDADYPVAVFAVIGGKRKLLWICPIYQTWASMLNRCYSTKHQADHPTYIGCTVTPEWLSFSAFRAWMLAQDWEGKELDKDILFQGNKVYSPYACVLVSKQLNSFMNDSGSSRGEWPIGVSLLKGKFMARCCNPFTRKREFLGYFTDPDNAHEAWRKRKYELALIYADQQTDPRTATALRARYAKNQGDAQ